MTAAPQPADAASAPPRRRPDAGGTISSEQHGKIGPNAITRMAEALTGRHGATMCRAVFADAGLLVHLESPPTRMVDEADVTRLHAAAFARLGAQDAAAVSREAGRLTADYLLAHRIPKPFQAVLRRLPRRLAAHILVRAIARHAWTFAGSGAFAFEFGAGLRLMIRGSAMCRELRVAEPACTYYAATFERLFGEMLGQVRCVETACEAIVVFAIAPAMISERWTTAASHGAFLGLVAYATYDLTNQATLRNWPVGVTIADLCWGTCLTACAATIGFLITRAVTSST